MVDLLEAYTSPSTIEYIDKILDVNSIRFRLMFQYKVFYPVSGWYHRTPSRSI